MSDIKQYEPLWGSWHVDSLLGEGSFGKVYKIHKEEFGRTYEAALKMISIPQSNAELRQAQSEGLDSVSVRSYFQAFVTDIVQEIDLMNAFKGSSNIVSLEDHEVIEHKDSIGWDILIRMELLTTLSNYVMEKPMTRDEVVKLGVHICRALELCAVRNTIHRDIKPDNIFISQYGDYKLGDFGIARQIERTMSGLSKKGTYTYMAPEVFKGAEYGASVDLYSLGIVMYRFLNKNRTPFLPAFPDPITPCDRDDALQRRMRGDAILPIADIDPELYAIVLKACAYDRAERFKNAAEMRAALETVRGAEVLTQHTAAESAPTPAVSFPAASLSGDDSTAGTAANSFTAAKAEIEPDSVPGDDKTVKPAADVAPAVNAAIGAHDDATQDFTMTISGDGGAHDEFEETIGIFSSVPEFAEQRPQTADSSAPPSWLKKAKIVGFLCFCALCVLSFMSGRRADLFAFFPVYAVCAVQCLLKGSNGRLTENKAADAALMVFLADSVFMGVMSDFRLLDYNILIFLASLISLYASGKRICATASGILLAACAALACFALFRMSQIGMNAELWRASAVPVLLLLASPSATLLRSHRRIGSGLLILIQIFMLVAFAAYALSNVPLFFYIADANFTGFSAERFRWWRYGRFIGLIVQAAAFSCLLLLSAWRKKGDNHL